MRYNVLTVLVLLGSMLGIALASYACASNRETGWEAGWNAGFASRNAQVEDANSRLVASGVCSYARLACAGRGK